MKIKNVEYIIFILTTVFIELSYKPILRSRIHLAPLEVIGRNRNPDGRV